MYMPVDERGHWTALLILDSETLCLFQSRGELFEAVELFDPSMTVAAAAIDLEIWEKSLNEAQRIGIKFAAEFLSLRQPRLVPIDEMLSEVKARRERQAQYASKRPSRVVSQRSSNEVI